MRYQSPSADALNGLWQNGFKARLWVRLHGPYPVERFQGRCGFERKLWFNVDRAEARKFEVCYGFNPRYGWRVFKKRRE